MCKNRLHLVVGSLQCGYCFNVFHRFNCALSMSKPSYLNIRRNGQWSCPSCIPQFVSKKRDLDKVCIQNWNLLYPFQRMLTILQKYDPLCNMLRCAVSRRRIKVSNLDNLYEFG